MARGLDLRANAEDSGKDEGVERAPCVELTTLDQESMLGRPKREAEPDEASFVVDESQNSWRIFSLPEEGEQYQAARAQRVVSLSGLRVTAGAGAQLRIAPLQRPGLRALARS